MREAQRGYYNHFEHISLSHFIFEDILFLTFILRVICSLLRCFEIYLKLYWFIDWSNENLDRFYVEMCTRKTAFDSQKLVAYEFVAK